MSKFIRKNSFIIFVLILLALEVSYSIGKTAQYYFYTDDYALLYHLQNNIFYGWPYHFVSLVYLPVFKLFGLMPEAFTILGITTYFILAIGVYFLNLIVFKKKSISFFASAIFATAYVGIDQFTQLAVSTVNNISYFLVCLILIVYIYFLQKQRKIFYFLSLALFIIVMYFFSFRGFTLALFIPAIEVILLLERKNTKIILDNIRFTLLRLIPFMLIGYKFGIFSYGKNVGENAVVPAAHLINLFASPFSLDFFTELSRIIGRIVAPETFFARTLSITISSEAYVAIGALFLLTSLIVAALMYKKNEMDYFRGLLFFTAVMIGGFAGNLILLLSFDSNGPINRYLNLSFVGYSGVVSALIYLFSKRIQKKFSRKISLMYPLSVLVIVLILISLSRNYEEMILRERSYPARNFFAQMERLIPKLSGNSVFYFDVSDIYPSPSRFGSILLGAYMKKEVVLASSYNVDINSIEIVDTLNEYISLKRKKPGGSFYSFYYDNKGLHQTTDKISALFEKGDRIGVNPADIEYSLNNLIPTVSIPVSNFYSLIPMKLEVELKITFLPISTFKFPYYGINSSSNLTEIEEFYRKNIKDKAHIYNYLLSRRNYSENVSIEVSSSHVEGQNPPEFLVDDKVETVWLADENSWQIAIKPWIKIDQKEQRKISKIVLRQVIGRIPSNYGILTSLDGAEWEKVQNIRISRGLFDDNLIINDFDPVTARFVMIKIFDTKNGFTPGLSEIEVIEDKYKDVDVSTGIRIKNNPFELIRNEEELQLAYDYVRQAVFLKVSTKTNKDENISNNYSIIIPILLDDQYNEYEIPLSPRGINLEKIKFELNFPARIDVGRMEISHQQL